MRKFKIGDTVRRTGRSHLGIRHGDWATVTGLFDVDGYILNHQTHGSHRECNLELATPADAKLSGSLRRMAEILNLGNGRPDEFRAACLRTGRLTKATPNFIDFEGESQVSPYETCKTQDGFGQARRVESLREELAAAEAALASQEELKERTRSINAEIRKHAACVQALSDVRDFGAGCATPVKARPEYAEFRKDLAEVLAPHGYKIVLIGDKSQGALVQV